MRKVDGSGVTRAVTWATAGVVAWAASLVVSVPSAHADAETQLMNRAIECHVAVKGVPGAECRKVTKFPDKAIDFVVQGDMSGPKPIKFRNPTNRCVLGWFDDALSCYEHPTYVADPASTWKVTYEDRGYLIYNVGAACYLYIDPTGVACAPGRPDPADATFYWLLLG